MSTVDLRAGSAFGILACGVLLGLVAGILSKWQVRISHQEGDALSMSYADLVAILLTVATLVVGIIVPLAGVFAFVFLRRDLLSKAEDLVDGEMKDGGKLLDAVHQAVGDAMEDKEGTVREFLSKIIEEEVAKQTSNASAGKSQWGNEANDYGEPAKPKEIP